MNYLAHLYLSGEDEQVTVGNFIGDYVKGKNYTNYPEKIQKGILMHRRIDWYTDHHKNFREAKKLLYNEYGLYSGIIIDLFYDHLLAKKWNYYSLSTLRTFAKRIHAILLSNFLHLPSRVQGFLPFLIQNRRLESYATTSGIQKSLEIMSRYTSLPDKSKKAIEILELNFSFLEKNFMSFMNDIIDFISNEFQFEIQRPEFINRF